MMEYPAGWLFPTSAARKAHYFAQGERRSACGQYGRFSLSDPFVEPETGHVSPDDCSACRKKIA